MSFAAFTELYEKDIRPRLKENTWLTKEHIIKTKILPYFGKRNISEITTKDVIAWQNDLIRAINPRTNKPYAKSYLKSVHSQLSAILNYAVKYYDLKDNVAAKVGNMGSEDEIRNDFWTVEECERFIEEVMYKPIFYYCFEMLYWTGMRVGELLALTLDDIDFEAKTID